MINVYSATEAKASADAFYGPLGQIFDYIRANASKGLYVVKVGGVELNSDQINVLRRAEYDVETVVDELDKVGYVVKWE